MFENWIRNRTHGQLTALLVTLIAPLAALLVLDLWLVIRFSLQGRWPASFTAAACGVVVVWYFISQVRHAGREGQQQAWRDLHDRDGR